MFRKLFLVVIGFLLTQAVTHNKLVSADPNCYKRCGSMPRLDTATRTCDAVITTCYVASCASALSGCGDAYVDNCSIYVDCGF